MGWKTSSILIQASADHKDEDILLAVGFRNLQQIDSKPYEVAIYPEKDTIFIGRYKGVVILSGYGLTDSNFESELSNEEEGLLRLFPQGEICSVSLHSVINHWGFSLIKDAEKIRVKAGDGDQGTFIEEGEPLKEELDLLALSRLNAQGKRIYELDGSFYNEDQVGENIVFQIFSRYTGIPLNEDEELLFNTTFAGFRVLPSNEPLSCDGAWSGEYVLGDGYGKSLKGTKGGFTLHINVNEGLVTGSCKDDDKPEAEPASINGICHDQFIWFIKRYPVTYLIDSKGNTYSDESVPPIQIAYTGLFDSNLQVYRGIWHIESKPFWGQWSMRRVINTK